MRLVACLAICLMPIMASAAQTGDKGPSNPEAYCVDGSAAFYPYTGEPCKSGYQLGLGNCRKTDGAHGCRAKRAVRCNGRHSRITV
jgi:hypothetical protein